MHCDLTYFSLSKKIFSSLLLHLANTVSHLLLSNRRRFRVCSRLSDATRRLVSRTHSRLHMYSLTSRVLVIACNNNFYCKL